MVHACAYSPTHICMCIYVFVFVRMYKNWDCWEHTVTAYLEGWRRQNSKLFIDNPSFKRRQLNKRLDFCLTKYIVFWPNCNCSLGLFSIYLFIYFDLIIFLLFFISLHITLFYFILIYCSHTHTWNSRFLLTGLRDKCLKRERIFILISTT